jgi:hypothetical protein
MPVVLSLHGIDSASVVGEGEDEDDDDDDDD